MSLHRNSANSSVAYSWSDEKRSMSNDNTPRRKRQARKRVHKEDGIARMTDADLVIFLGREETEREGDQIYEKSQPIFMTYIEKRDESARSLGLAEILNISDVEMIPIFDVYVGIDCCYRSVGWFLSIDEAKMAACSVRLRWERHLKNHLKGMFDLDKPWIPPAPGA